MKEQQPRTGTTQQKQESPRRYAKVRVQEHPTKQKHSLLRGQEFPIQPSEEHSPSEE